MCRHFQIKNLVLSLATFCLGVAAASLFSPSPVTRTREEIVPDILYKSETCVDGDYSPPQRGFIHTERLHVLADRIRDTEKALIDLKRRNYIFSQKAEREAGVRQGRLEV